MARLFVRELFRGQRYAAGRTMFCTGVAAAALQAIAVREVLSVAAGNELVVGVVFAVWLAATAAGSISGARITLPHPDIPLLCLCATACFGLTGIRAARLLLMPGTAMNLPQVTVMLFACAAPIAFTGGWIFGGLARQIPGSVYRWEQAGALCGFAALSGAVALFAPNYPMAVAVLLPIALLLKIVALRVATVVLLIVFSATDRETSSWKYPVPVTRISYAREGEVARATVDGESIVFVNGAVYRTGVSLPAVEQAVHVPLGMHPRPRSILIINSAGHIAEAEKYPAATVACIRTDRLIDDTCCPYQPQPKRIGGGALYDAVIAGCGMPDNAASARMFTRSFFIRMRELTGDSGIFSFTLPLQSDYAGGRDWELRDIIVSTLSSVYKYVKILPGEGLTFTASQIGYRFPDTCLVPNGYFQNMVLAGLSAGRLQSANALPAEKAINTAARPLLLFASIGRYFERADGTRGMLIAFAVVMVAMLLPVAARPSSAALSIGSSGCCAGVFSVATVLLYQSNYGTVYGALSALMLSLAAGFAAGCFVRKFPLSDLAVGIATGGMLLVLSSDSTPPAPLFFIGNAVTGFLVSAQFVTRREAEVGRLYAADCAGGVLGMSLSSTVLLPVFGAGAVGVMLLAFKVVAHLVAMARPGR